MGQETSLTVEQIEELKRPADVTATGDEGDVITLSNGRRVECVTPDKMRRSTGTRPWDAAAG